MNRGMSKKVVSLVLASSVLMGVSASAADVTKNETVYVNLDNDGSTSNITVSDWLHSESGSIDTLDKSNLTDIKNVKSDEEPKKNGDTLKWNSDSSDIFYQGKTNKELPLDVNVNYYLDDKKMDASEMAGKSGKVKIEIEIENKSYEEKDINGKKRNIYTPFSTASIVTLPLDKFSNVTTDNGVMVSEGNNNIITFVAFPGLKESLGLDDDKLKENDALKDVNFDNKITIEADTDCFELNPIMITATSELPNLDGLKEADTISDLKDALNKLKDGSDQLVEGTGELNDGVQLAKEKSDEGFAMLYSPDLQNKIDLIKNPYKVNLSNKLLDDAFFAQGLDLSKSAQLLNLLNDENFNRVAGLAGSAKDVMKYKNMLQTSLRSGDAIMKDQNFNAMLKQITLLETQYKDLKPETKTKVDTLLAIGTPENLIKAQSLLRAALSTKEDFNTLDQTVKAAIQKCPGYTETDKTIFFIQLLEENLENTQELLKDDTINQLNMLSKDVPAYASSYLVLKSELAVAFNVASQTGGVEAGEKAFQAKKAELEQYIDGVYGQGGAELKQYIDGLKSSDLTKQAIESDVTKIGQYKTELPGIVTKMNDVKVLKPVIDALVTDMSKQGEVEKLGQLLSTLNDSQTQKLLNALGDAVCSFTPEEIQTLGDITSSAQQTLQLVNSNQQNLNAIKTMLNTLQGQPNLSNDLNNFDANLNNCEGLINELESNSGNFTKANMNNLKDMSEKLVGMQQDLKDGDEILRMLKDALQQGNVDRARSLINSLPELQDKVQLLSDGSLKLKEGMDQFSTEGINELYSKGNDGISDAEDLLAAKDELVNMSKDYMTFTSKEDEMDGTVKFIMKTPEITYEEPVNDNSDDNNDQENKGFFQKIADFFKNLF